MHIYFAVSGRRPDVGDGDAPVDAGQLLVLRDPQDESEWQYLGNPEVAARTSLAEIVAGFIQDCSAADGSIDPAKQEAATGVRDALVRAAKQIDDALEGAPGR